MKLLLDTGKLEEIRKACSWGVIDGVSTNPTFIKAAVEEMNKKGQTIDMEGYIAKIFEGVDGPVTVSIMSSAAEQIIEEAELLHDKFNRIRGNVVVKIPVSPRVDDKTSDFDGLQATKQLVEKGIKVTLSMIMTPEQAILAAKAGATYISPLVGRIDDYLRKDKLGESFAKRDYFPAEGKAKAGEIKDDRGIVSGVDLVEKIVDIYKTYDIETVVVVSSIRDVRQVREVALAGAPAVTVPFYVLEEMMRHPKTLEGARRYSTDVVPGYAKIFEKG